MTTLSIAQPDSFAETEVTETNKNPTSEKRPTLVARLTKAIWDHSEELNEGSTKSFEGLL